MYRTYDVDEYAPSSSIGAYDGRLGMYRLARERRRVPHQKTDVDMPAPGRERYARFGVPSQSTFCLAGKARFVAQAIH